MADLKSRIQFKHDTAANWAKATNFIPLIGEIIIYDTDGDTPVRFKIGDGINYVNALPFASKEEALLYTAQNLTEEQKSQARENIDAISSEDMYSYVNSKIVYIPLLQTDNTLSLGEGWTYDKIVQCINNNIEVFLKAPYSNGTINNFRCVGLIKYSNYDYVVPEFVLLYNYNVVRRLVVHPESIYPDGNVFYSSQMLVPQSRTINGHALSANVVLTAEDIGVEEGATNNTITIKTWTAADVEGGN